MPSSYAFLFKVHFWDGFTARRLAALRTLIRDGDVFVLADDTNGAIAYAGDARLVRYSEAHAGLLGLAPYPQGQLLWYNVDYPMYFFYSAYPEYDYYVMCEYDAAFNRSIDDLVRDLRERAADYLGNPMPTPFDRWAWAASVDGVYAAGVARHNHHLAFSAYSRRAVRFLLERRRRLTLDFAAGAFPRWPFSEAFVPTELIGNGFVHRELGAYGSVARCDWWPPHREAEWERQTEPAFIHPLLDDRRFLAALFGRHDVLADLLDDSWVRRRAQMAAPNLFLPHLLAELQRRAPEAAAHVAKRLAAWSQPGRLPNIALGKPATQSSVSQWSREATPPLDAAGAVNGRPSGTYAFHTLVEENPWWSVDLERVYLVFSTTIRGRPGFERRNRCLTVLSSVDAREWHLVFRHRPEPGTADPLDFDIPFAPPIPARFIRIELDDRNCLHLDQVEIRGREMTSLWMT